MVTAWVRAHYFTLSILWSLLVPVWLVLPSYIVPQTSEPTNQTLLAQIDWQSELLDIAALLSLALATTLSGSDSAWSSRSASTLWAVGVLCLVRRYVAQQKMCMLITKDRRILPDPVLADRTIMSKHLGLLRAATVQGSQRCVPFTVTFVAGSAISGKLPAVLGQHKVMQMYGGLKVLIASALITTQMRPSVSESTVMGLKAVLGIGVDIVLRL